jgi:hypothetical protein
MLKRPFRTALLAIMVLVIAIAGYTAYWYSAAAEVRAGIARWSDERRAAGWSVELGEPDIGGFPMRIDLRLQTPKLGGPGAHWRWALPNVRIFAAPWSPRNISVLAPGIHVFTNRQGEYSATFDRAEGDLAVEPGMLSKAVVRFAGIDIRQPPGIRVRAETVTLRMQAKVLVDRDKIGAETGTGFALDARSVVLPDAWQPPLGAALARLSIDAVVTGSIEPRGKLAEILARWRDGGGAVEVKALAVDWQMLKLRADGTFALDAALQPEGAMTAEIDGIDPTTDALIAAGAIDAKTAFAAKIANRALSFGNRSARLPLSIQKQRLYFGPVPILRLKPIRWE